MNELLEHQRFCWEFSSNNSMLSNHLPMAYVAIKNLGATSGQINKFVKNYIATRQLEPIQNSEISKYFYEISIEEIEFNDLYLGAFHGIIQIQYGLIENNHNSILSGLNYYRSLIKSIPKLFEYEEKGTSQNLSSHLTIQDFLKIATKQKPPTNQSTITQSLLEFVSSDNNRIRTLISNVDIDNIESLLQISLNVYANSIKLDFYSLHCITGIWAALYINEVKNITNLIEKLKYPILTILGICLASKPQLINKIFENTHMDKPTESIKPIDNAQLIEFIDKAKNSLDDHQIKLTYTLINLSKLFPKIDFMPAFNNIF